VSLVDAIARGLAAGGVARWVAPRGPLVVMYHGVGGSDGVPTEALRAQLEALKARRRVVPLREAAALLGRPEAHDVAAVTFDDGYLDFAELAAPVLRGCHVHATVFVPGGKIGGENDWDRGRAPAREIMGEAALRALDPLWIEVGVHGLSHRRLRGLDEESLRQETAGARARVEDACGRPAPLFAYPYGQSDDFDRAAERAVADAGFVAACSTRFGRGSRPEEIHRLRRVGIGCRDSLAVVERKLDGAYDWTASKERLGARLRALRGAAASG
jgi:peptidoglycan/xylan/chitin deacetylase (PgdA/CDA1 family)